MIFCLLSDRTQYSQTPQTYFLFVGVCWYFLPTSSTVLLHCSNVTIFVALDESSRKTFLLLCNHLDLYFVNENKNVVLTMTRSNCELWYFYAYYNKYIVILFFRQQKKMPGKWSKMYFKKCGTFSKAYDYQSTRQLWEFVF